jgi:tryptophanyl-tRNA synthetase
MMDASTQKPVVLSGIQPSGHLTIGNYIGALKHWVRLQDSHQCLFVLVDLHAITVRQDPQDLRKRCYDFLALYLACGIDPGKSTVFVQSHVPAHAGLAWVLNCFTYMGELSRMTQFKDKARKHQANINVGLFAYPALMAADILLYQADLVPVGADQRQHLEIARDLALRFNGIYGQVFTVPEAYIPPVGARVMSLQDPASKMSKSDDNAANYLALLDPPEVARNKIKRAVTDCGAEIAYDPDQRPGISNLVSIYGALSGQDFSAIQAAYAGRGYAPFKADLAEMVAEFLKPIQQEYGKVRRDRAYMHSVLKAGASEAARRSGRTMDKVYRKLGFIEREA